jgi:RNA polymerase sigma factor (sigma-70 family)
VQTVADLTDSQLLERFARQHEAAAFEVLVRRHGPMVLRVCQRVLYHPHDAEDAFQATFVVLMRKAPSIAKLDSLASWLHRVAYRIALRARSREVVRQGHERASAREQREPEASSADPAWRELRPVLDEELNQLPEKYRTPLVLCYLEGKTNDEAAQQLGWSRGTVAGKLSRGRDLLRDRLARRGLALSAGALALLLGKQAASAAVPAGLATATVHAATVATAGNIVGGSGVSAQAAALADGALKAMAAVKLKVAAAVLAVTAVAGGSALWATADSWPLRATIDNPGGVVSLAFSPDGSRIVTGASDHSAKVWNVAGRELEGTFMGHGAEATAAFSPDGLTLAVGSGDGFVQLWDWQKHVERVAVRPHSVREGVAWIACNPKGGQVATAGWDKVAKLLDPATGRERAVLRGHASGISHVAYSADGSMLATGSNDGTVKIWDTDSAALRRTLRGHVGTVGPVAFAPDGKTLASGASKQGDVILWDLSDGSVCRSFPAHAGGVLALAFSPDGQTLVSGGADKLARLWNPSTGAERQTLAGHTRDVSALAFSPKGRILATASYDGTVKFWGAATDK